MKPRKRQVRSASKKNDSQRRKATTAMLDELIEEATIDAYGESEQTTGFFTMLEDHLALPFKAEVLGVHVTVERIEMTDDEQIVAVCASGKSRQRIPIIDLPVPAKPPEGSEWIAAYRRWVHGR